MRVIGRTTAIEAPLDSDTVWIRYGVEDSGKGLSKAELEKLFARFSQANPKVSSRSVLYPVHSLNYFPP